MLMLLIRTYSGAPLYGNWKHRIAINDRLWAVFAALYSTRTTSQTNLWRKNGVMTDSDSMLGNAIAHVM